MMNNPLTVLTLSLIFICGQSVPKECQLRYETQNCDFKIPKTQISEKVSVFYSGISLGECMLKVESMKWKYGLYCNESELCGLGIDLQSEYEIESGNNDITPVIERCDLIVNRQNTNCADVLTALYDIKILRVSDYTCLGQGFEYCERERLTKCEDVLGGFMCYGCLEGTIPTQDNDESHCQDINECDLGVCGSAMIECVINAPMYTCLCQQGYHFNGTYGAGCADIDECDISINYCGSLSGCVNSAGSYTCQCGTGFQQTSFTYGSGCEDINECTTADICGAHTCVNLEPHYKCMCNDGYEQNSTDFTQCIDKDECNPINICGSDHLCANSGFPYSCQCNQGYTFDSSTYGKGCEDINECAVMSDICGIGHECNNSVSPYTCECTQGYKYNGVYDQPCQDVNECDDGVCGDDAISCTNNDGGYHCECPDNFYFDSTDYGTGCNDIRNDDEVWLNVFSVEAFSGVNILDYFRFGTDNPASPTGFVRTDKIYRHERMIEKLDRAKFTRFTLYDLEMNRVKYLIFQPLTADDFASWFTWERVYYNWGWNFDAKSTGSDGHIFNIWDTVSGSAHSQAIRSFQIFDRYNSCNDVGWFLAVIYIPPSLENLACPFERWWRRQDFINAGITNPNQPPAFIYADTVVAMNFNNHKIGGKITIDVFRAKRFSATEVTPT